MEKESEIKRLYCVYCSNIFASNSDTHRELCTKHPDGYKAGPHYCQEFTSVANRIKKAKKG